MRLAATAVAAAVALALGNAGAGQATGSITVRAVLGSGGWLHGVAVTVTSAEGVRRTGVAGVGGEVTVDGLAAGVYRVQGELAGFRTAVADHVVVAAGGAARVELLMRPGILEEVHYAMPLGGTRGALNAADIVVHLRVAGSLGSGLLGHDRTMLATRHTATVLAVVKGVGRGIATGRRIGFWQHMAGEWEQDGRRIIGPEVPFPAGKELVAFLTDDPKVGRAELRGPHLMFEVRNGTVYRLRQPSLDLPDGMPVNAFLGELRRILNQPPPPGCGRAAGPLLSETPHAEFEGLYVAWHQETQSILTSSNPWDYIRLPSYRKIVALGGAAVPALERKMVEDKSLDFMLAYAVVEICGWDIRELRDVRVGELGFRDRVLRRLRQK